MLNIPSNIFKELWRLVIFWFFIFYNAVLLIEEIRVGVEAGRVGPDNFVCTRLTEDGTKGRPQSKKNLRIHGKDMEISEI